MKKNYLVPLLTIAVLIFLPCVNYGLEDEGTELKLYLGEIKFIPVRKPTRIIIGNPAVADVTSVTNDEITLTPKALGATAFIFWDSYGEQSYRITVSSEDMSETKRRIDNMLVKLDLPEVYTKAEDKENKVLLLGRVKTAQDRERISLALGPLKDKTIDLIEVKEEEAIVEINLEVLELDKGATSTLGFTWPGSVTIATDQPQAGGGTATTTVVTAPSNYSTFFDITRWSRTNFEWKLDLLIQEGKARVLSRPRLTCQSGKEAELLVGGEKPIFTTTVAATTGAAGTEVEYKEYGIRLNIKPTVTGEDRLKVALNVEISELESSTPETIGSAVAPTAKAYPLTKRNASTEVFLDDEQTLAIGGLIKQKSSEELRKLPWLGEIPLLGMFFRQRTTSSGGGSSTKGDTELFITLTPKIVSLDKSKKPALKEKETVKIIESQPQKPLVGYAESIQKTILENLTYPNPARELGLEGTVNLILHLSSAGGLLDTLVKNSSGHDLLDEAAVEVAKKITAYPSFPPSVDKKDIWIEVPIVYQLD